MAAPPHGLCSSISGSSWHPPCWELAGDGGLVQGLCGGLPLPLGGGQRPEPPTLRGIIVSSQLWAGGLAGTRGHPAAHHTGLHSGPSLYIRGGKAGPAPRPEDGGAPAGPGRPCRGQRGSAQCRGGRQACTRGSSSARGPPAKAVQGGRHGLIKGQNKAGLQEAAAFGPCGLCSRGCWEHRAGPPGRSLRPPPAAGLPSPPAGPPAQGSQAAASQGHCNNSCKCEGSGDKGRSGRQLGDSCRQTILDVKCVPLTKVLI